MTSTLVSPCIGLRETFQHGRFLNHPLSPTTVNSQTELLSPFSETSVSEKIGVPAAGFFSSANPISRPPISRRHSSSVFSSVSKPSSQLSTLPETHAYMNNLVGKTFDVLVEEQFRNRAYSEGSTMLSGDVLSDPGNRPQSPTSRYKTELCRPFEESGKCKYGDKCQFAHGKHELRYVARHPKYKTELCRTYHSSGICPYGSRCHFIHNHEEPNMGIKKQMSSPGAGSISQANVGSRPVNLQISPQNVGSGCSYSPPIKSPNDTNCFFAFGSNETALMSPRSPIEKANGQFFNYSRAPLSPNPVPLSADARRTSSSMTKFEFPQTHFPDMQSQDDGVFSGSLTPPDSDRESATGSPPGFGAAAPSQQRLPIFRCLSQSEQKVYNCL